jgi:hypothetical protein
MLKGRTCLLVGLAMLSSVALSACTSTGGTPQAAVNKGTVSLEAIRVGTPESVFKEAIITFIPDPNGTTDQKNQYTSRFTDEAGGQYVVQAKDDISYEIGIVHREKTLTKEDALARLKRLLPMNVKDEPVVVTPATAKNPSETYKIGDAYSGTIIYKDGNAKEATLVQVTRTAPVPVAANVLDQ